MRVDGTWVGFGLVALVAGALLYTQQSGFRSPDPELNADQIEAREIARSMRPDRVKACTTIAGEPEARLDACLSSLSAPRLSSAAREVLADLRDRGRALVTGPRLGVENEQVAIADVEGLRGLLMGSDEAAAAQALRDAGVEVVVAYRDLTGALDRDARVLSRLAQHDWLEWFQLRHVTEELFVYTVRSSPAVVPVPTGDALLRGLRARLEGETPPAQDWSPGDVQLIGTMRLQGRTLVRRYAGGGNLERVLDQLAAKLDREWRREVAVDGHGRLEDRLDDIRIEVHVIMERAPVEPRSRHAIFDLWEMGVDGVLFRHRDGIKNQKFTYVPGSELVHRSYKSADKFLREAVREYGWRDLRPWEDSSTRLEIMRTSHFIEGAPGGGDAVRLFRGVPEVGMDEVTDDNVRQMLVDGAEWWLRNQHDDGSFNYKFWPTQNRMSSSYNEVRHILAPRDLMDAWRYRPDPRYVEGAEKAMDWLLQHAVHDTDEPVGPMPHPPEGTMLFRVANNQKLGTVAVALLGWVEWAKATGDRSQDENIRKMAKFVQYMQEDNGKFDPYYVHQEHSYFGQKNDIVPGEAALALGEVAEYFGEPGWMEFFPKFLDYYEPWFRERAKKVNEHGRWPHDTYTNETRLDLVQFGPWAVMACKQYYLLTGDERAAAFGLEVADWMIDHYQWSEERSPFPDYVGGYYKIPQELPAMQTFCYSEGTAAAYTIASRFAPDRKDKYDRSTREAIRFLRVMQYDDHDAFFTPASDLIHGGIKYAMNENKIRIDYVGHGLSTLSQYLDAREVDPAAELELSDLDLQAPPNPDRAPWASVGGE